MAHCQHIRRSSFISAQPQYIEEAEYPSTSRNNH